MSLVLSLANHADADRIAEIHMAAFGTNAMLLAQFPTPKVREGLQKSIKLKALADIDDARQIVLVVRTLPQNTEDRQLQVDDLPQAVHDKQPDSNGRVIAFAKWTKPIFDGEEDNEPSWIWPEGTNWNMLDKWTKKTDEAHEKAVGRMRCYRLHFIGTDPSYQNRGAGSLMLQWGIDQCQKDGVLAYVESTMEAVLFYKKHDFSAVETFHVDIDEGFEPELPNIYQETSLIFKPQISR